MALLVLLAGPARTRVVAADLGALATDGLLLLAITAAGGLRRTATRRPPGATKPTAPAAKPEPKPEPARPFPRLAPAPSPAYLSVRFHDVVARPPHAVGDGPDPSLVALHLPDHPVSGERMTFEAPLPDDMTRALGAVQTYRPRKTKRSG